MSDTEIQDLSGQQDHSVTTDAGTSNETARSAPAETFNRNDYVHKTRVTELIHERTREVAQKAAEKARAEAEAQSQSSSSSTGMGGMQGMSEDRFRQLAAEEFKRQAEVHRKNYETESHQRRMDDLANDYMGKLAAAKETYPDLIQRQDEIGDLALLVPYINETSEVAGISQHLLDNEAAFAQLLVLQKESPDRVRRVLKKIEAAIKTNDVARTRSYPLEPLSDVTPSKNAMDSGTGSIESLKKQSYLRG